MEVKYSLNQYYRSTRFTQDYTENFRKILEIFNRKITIMNVFKIEKWRFVTVFLVPL